MTLVNASGGSWVPTWISWYVSADESKVPCTWPLYRWHKGQSVKASFYAWCFMGMGRSQARLMSRPARGGEWEPVQAHPVFGAFQFNGYVCGPGTRTIIVDLDHGEHATQERLLWCAAPLRQRSRGGRRVCEVWRRTPPRAGRKRTTPAG